MYKQELEFWLERQSVLKELQAGAPTSPRSASAHCGSLALVPLCTPPPLHITAGSLRAQQALLDLATAQHGVQARLQQLRDKKASLAERKLAAQSQLLGLLDGEVQGAYSSLDAGAAECERALRTLETLSADLAGALRSANPAACELQQGRAAAYLEQLLGRLELGPSPLCPPTCLGPSMEAAGAVEALARQVTLLEERVGSMRLAAGAGLQPGRPQGPSTGGNSEEDGQPGEPEALQLELPVPSSGASSSLRKLQAVVRVSNSASPAKLVGHGPAAIAAHSPIPAQQQQPQHQQTGSAGSQALRSKYREMLAGMQQRHAEELVAARAEHSAQLAQQEEAHRAALAAQREQLLDPARDVEMCLLRDDLQVAKEKVRALAAEYDSRLQVAAFQARCEAEAAHQQQLATLRREYGAVQAEAEALRDHIGQLKGGQGAETAEALALQQAQADAVAALQQVVHAEELAALQAHFSALLAEREAEHSALLAELAALKSCVSSAAPSRADTRQEAGVQHTGAPGHGFHEGGWGQPPQQQGRQQQPAWQVYDNPASGPRGGGRSGGAASRAVRG